MKQYYVIGSDGRQQGPFSEAHVRSQYLAGVYKPNTSVWCEGMPQWQPLATVFAAEPFSGATPYDGPTEKQIGNPFRAMAYAISHMLRFSGRARRKEFWMATLGFAIVMILLAFLLSLSVGPVPEPTPQAPLDLHGGIEPGMSATEIQKAIEQAADEQFRHEAELREVREKVNGVGLVFMAFLAFYCFVNLSMTCRRLHDTGRTGWMQLICLVPYLGSIVILALCCFDSTPGTNQYGPNPKGR